METGGDDPNAIRSRGRIRLQIPLAYRSPPDPNAGARGGSTFLGPFTAGEVMDPSGESPPGEPTEQEECFDDDDAADSSSSSWAWADNDSFQLARAGELRRPGAESDYPGAPRTRSGTRSRQHPRATRHPEHPGEMSSSEPEVTNLQSASPSAGAQVDDITGIRIRQSALYSNRPRRPRRRHASLLTQDHPSEVSSSDLAGAVADLPTLESLSLSEPPPLTPPISGEVTGDDDDETKEHPRQMSSSEHGTVVTELPLAKKEVIELPRLEGLSLSDPPVLTPQTAEESDDDNDDVRHEPIELGIGTFGPLTLRYSPPPPQPEWLGGIRGQRTLEEIAADASYVEPDPSRTDAHSVNDSDYDTEEELRLLDEYLAANTCTSIRQGFDKIIAVEHDALTKLAAKMGIEPPPPRQAKHMPVDREAESLQAQQQPSPAAAQTQHSKAPRKPRCEASNAELVENAKNWMREEVKMVFEKYIERRDDLKGLDCCFDELCHQCFNVEHYNKIFHHYNFTVKMKQPDSVDWVVALYFAEVKQIFGRKYYFCCRLEQNENGNCYACKSQGVDDLQHPATSGFDKGLPNAEFGLCYE